MSTTTSLSPGALIVSQSATPFLNFIRTATIEELNDAYSATTKDSESQEERDDLDDKRTIIDDLRAFREHAFPEVDQSSLCEDTVFIIQGLSNKEYRLTGSPGICTQEDARKIARSIFYPDAPQVSEPIRSSDKTRVNVEETSTGCGMGALFRSWLPRSRLGRESASSDS